MKKFQDLTGQKFGKLTVLCRAKDYISPSGHKSIKWECKCDCKNTCFVIGHSLIRNNAKQCEECKYKSRQLNGYISSNFFCRIRHNAKIRNIYFDSEINREYLWDLFLKQNKKCALSGLPIHFSQTSRKKTSDNWSTSSLDRINSSKGYIKDNIQWLHKDINNMKWDLNQKEFIKFCKKIWRYNNEKN